MDNLLQAVKHCDCKVIYDIGSNKGYWTDAMKNKINEGSNIFYGFEANPNLLGSRKAEKNFNVPLYHSDDMILKFYLNTKSNHTEGNSFYKEKTVNYEDEATIVLKTKKLDTLIEEEKIQLPDLIKIDTQGAELDILKGGENAVNNAKIVMTELSVYSYNQDGAKFSDVNDWLLARDFLPIAIEEYHWYANVLLQMDLVYMKREELSKHFPNVNELL